MLELDGADIDIQDGMEMTALMWTSRSNSNSKTVQLLIEAGASLDIQDDKGRTALILASANSNSKIIPLLIEAGASLDIQDHMGRTALIWASQNSLFETIQLLLKHGADPNIRNNDGETAYQRCDNDLCRVIFKVFQFRHKLDRFSKQLSRQSTLSFNTWILILEKQWKKEWCEDLNNNQSLLDLRALAVILKITEDTILQNMSKEELCTRISKVLAMGEILSPNTLKRLKQRSDSSRRFVNKFIIAAERELHVDIHGKTGEEIMKEILRDAELEWPPV